MYKRRGTSLTELVTVIVILGIIAAILVPTIGNLIKRTKEKTCKMSIDNIINSYNMLVNFEFSMSDNQRYQYLDEVMKEYSATKTTYNDKVAYEGLCEEGGLYVFEFDSNGKLIGHCTGH